MTEVQHCLHPGGIEFTEKLIAEAALKMNDAVLDAGCGAGSTVKWLLEKGFDTYGVDRHPEQISARIQQGELQQMPYAAECFHAVISECTAFICGDTRMMLLECNRVLKQDGWLLLADVYFAAEKPLPRFSDDRPVTMGQWQQMLQDCGFAIEKIEDVSAAWKPFVIEQLWAGRTLEDLWGGCFADGQTDPSRYKPGYFLLWARKGANSNE